MILTKTCSKTDPLSDYNDLVTAINDMISSGVVATGDITDYHLTVDSSIYSGEFGIYIPYSGCFTIDGDNTTFIPTGTCSISGNYFLNSNFKLKRFYLDCIDLTDYCFIVNNDCGFEGENLEFIDCYKGIDNYGYLTLNNTNSCGLGSGTFINSSNVLSVKSSTISDYTYGIKTTSGDANVIDCGLFGNNYDIYASDNSTLKTQRTLLYGATDIYLSNSTLEMVNSTLVSDVPISGDNSYISISHSILKSSGNYTIFGSTLSGIVEYTDLYENSWESANISGVYNYNQDPIFADESNYDYRLLINAEHGSFAINAGRRLLDSRIDIDVDTSKFMIYDQKELRIPHVQVKEFLYKDGKTIVFSDTNREVRMAELLNYYNSSLSYQQTLNILLSFTDVPVTQSFTDAGNALYPYEWDYWTAPTTEITNENIHIIPRSIIDISSLILPLIVGFGFDFGILNKNNIIVSNRIDYRGISFDADLLAPGEAVIWTVEGRNQKLVKRDAFTGELIFEYPLLTPRPNNFIRPAGIILMGPFGDKWKFINPLNPSLEYIAESKLGDFSWINPTLDMKYDLRGILAYKENLYITGTNYIDPITNRDSIPLESGIGCILLYNNNLRYKDYMADTPTRFVLSVDNDYPTDITIYEDGRLWITDYASGVFQYKPVYDYGLIENTYDKEVMVILKEEYNNVEI